MSSHESSEINALLAEAESLLQRGNEAAADQVLQRLHRSYSSNALALHAIGALKVSAGKTSEALSLFGEAYKLDNNEPARLHADAIAAAQHGRFAIALTLLRAARALAPADIALLRDLARVAMVANALDEAVAAGRELTAADGSPENFRLLAHAHAARFDWPEAREALERALALGLAAPGASLDRAVILDEMGDPAACEALAALAQRTTEPEIAARYARALAADGQQAAARVVLEDAARRWPGATDFRIELAKLLYAMGDDQSAARTLEAALHERPDDTPLRLACADLMRRRGCASEARTLLSAGLARAPNAIELRTSMGVVLDDLGETDEALRLLQSAVRDAPQSLSAKLNLAVVSLRAGQPQAALEALADVRRARPYDQLALAFEALALRLLGAPHYRALYDYDRLVRVFDLAPPEGWASIEAFNADLAATLHGLHRTVRQPLAQSLQGGTQTDRNLPLANPIIAAFLGQARRAVRLYVEALRDDPSHPLDSRKSADFRFAGTWSVRLRPNGFHINHVHPAGWLSSAYYVELPSEIGASSQAGWLKFGEPATPIPGCTPEKFVQPKAGRLVLFPSYMWHGTVPFSAGGDRLTIAFDIVPR